MYGLNRATFSLTISKRSQAYNVLLQEKCIFTRKYKRKLKSRHIQVNKIIEICLMHILYSCNTTLISDGPLSKWKINHYQFVAKFDGLVELTEVLRGEARHMRVPFKWSNFNRRPWSVLFWCLNFYGPIFNCWLTCTFVSIGQSLGCCMKWYKQIGRNRRLLTYAIGFWKPIYTHILTNHLCVIKDMFHSVWKTILVGFRF